MEWSWYLPAKEAHCRHEYLALESSLEVNTGILLQDDNQNAKPMYEYVIVGLVFNILKKYPDSKIIISADERFAVPITGLVQAMLQFNSELVTPSQSQELIKKIWNDCQVVITSRLDLITENITEVFYADKIRSFIHLTCNEELKSPSRRLAERLRTGSSPFRSIYILMKNKLWEECEEESFLKTLRMLQISKLVVQDAFSEKLLSQQEVRDCNQTDMKYVAYVIKQLTKINPKFVTNENPLWELDGYHKVKWEELFQQFSVGGESEDENDDCVLSTLPSALSACLPEVAPPQSSSDLQSLEIATASRKRRLSSIERSSSSPDHKMQCMSRTCEINSSEETDHSPLHFQSSSSSAAASNHLPALSDQSLESDSPVRDGDLLVNPCSWNDEEETNEEEIGEEESVTHSSNASPAESLQEEEVGVNDFIVSQASCSSDEGEADDEETSKEGSVASGESDENGSPESASQDIHMYHQMENAESRMEESDDVCIIEQAIGTDASQYERNSFCVDDDEPIEILSEENPRKKKRGSSSLSPEPSPQKKQKKFKRIVVDSSSSE